MRRIKNQKVKTGLTWVVNPTGWRQLVTKSQAKGLDNGSLAWEPANDCWRVAPTCPAYVIS